MTAEVRTPIVVCIDEDPSCREALAWGADEADGRRLPLRLLMAWGPTDPRPAEPMRLRENQQTHDPRGSAVQNLREAVAYVQNRHPHLEVSTLLVVDAPAPIVRDQARTATALVLSSRWWNRRGRLFASAPVALPAIAHATCPVVVVRNHEPVSRQPFFVVGVDVGWDGRHHSAAAVDLAFEEAARRGAALRVLYVWRPPLLGVPDERAALRECRQRLPETVAVRQALHPAVDVHHRVISGHPAQVLAQESAHALGLIVGTRGPGCLPGPPLGSVLHSALRHAQCPVVAVPRPSACRHPRGQPRVSLLSCRARRAVGQCTRMLTCLARARLGRSVRVCRACARLGCGAIRGSRRGTRWFRWRELRRWVRHRAGRG
ncbi:universal stress protein [Streptomyces lasiicapitis]|uniref:universal stress protein n=1 Tax=Streptomyces lasiicapitis TaxID=1923961 RepID=UPI00332A5D96